MVPQERNLQEQTVSPKYDRLSNRLLLGGFLALALGTAIAAGFGVRGLVNNSRNPYRNLPAVTKHSEIEQDLRDIRSMGGPELSLEQIAERNPELIDPSKIRFYIDKRKKGLGALEHHPDYVACQDWKRENVSPNYRYAGWALGLGFGSDLLACIGLYVIDKKKEKLRAFQKKDSLT